MNNIRATSLFPKGYRASGVVLDIAALPSPYGIGDVGPCALKWIDRLCEAGQSWWHALQVSESNDYKPSYSSDSSFAGDILLISPDWLIEDGLLSRQDCACVAFLAGSIDYDVVVPFKYWLLQKAWSKFNAGTRKDLFASYEHFRKRQAHWLEDYALFHALKTKYRGAHYREWPAELVSRNSAAISDARHELTSQIDQARFSQFILFRQSQRLKEYARSKGIRLIGDLPFFISADSSEAWANAELFVSDDERYASGYGKGLVPVCFSSSDRVGSCGDRGALSRVSYRWCVDRLRALLAHVDVARVDVRALAAPWHAAAGAPATELIEDMNGQRLTEAGGLITDGFALDPKDGFAFRDKFNVPEARILQLAFDGCPDNPHYPQHYTPNSVVYASEQNGISMHEWFDNLSDRRRQAFWDYLKRPSGEHAEVAWELIRLAWSSAAGLAMVPLPDLLNLGADRINQNDCTKGHRGWRCSEEMLSAPAFYWLRELTRRSNRSPEVKKITKPVALRSSRLRTRKEAVL